MNETEFGNHIRGYLAPHLSAYQVTTKRALLYKVIVDANGCYRPNNPANPQRGTLAFQTDLLISRDTTPLVVCELKYKKGGGFTTHDILIYSTKAVKHKEVYPYLRYGFVAGNTDVLTNKFFTHNVGFDFAIAMQQLTDASMERLLKLVRAQIRNAEMLRDRLAGNPGTVVFSTGVALES